MIVVKARNLSSASEWPSSSPNTSRWAVEETGRNSVAAWTRPSRTAERKLKGRNLADARAIINAPPGPVPPRRPRGCVVSLTGCDRTRYARPPDPPCRRGGGPRKMKRSLLAAVLLAATAPSEALAGGLALGARLG